ncbi:response regulator transcription factor [Cohnella thailandensis]|uniref:Response regulator n=1 Tax=Cohnella thailandensis TaxID=557557 RepID=A0A841T3F8_9BACL|nr:response regulator [Cohnella thailandensis]MBB6637155.1 response regulator [Cohnella thailandensis]MBP1977027.1 two-component system response regulator YesN [Cohnella thailandensis]
MNYRLLIVDDEIHAIEGLKADLDPQKLGISELYTANNIRQAKEWFESERIDIMLCDIEMPQGSGLELLDWVREHSPDTATIFITSHADFKYAKQALQLGSLDYLLKPVLSEELESAIRKARSVIEQNSENNRNSKIHQLWQKHQLFLIERFWLDLINHSTPSSPAAVREQVERNHLPIAEGSAFYPILISVNRWNKELKRRDEKILEYAIKNSAEEMIVGSRASGICFSLDRGLLLVILMAERNTDWDEESLRLACQGFVESCHRYFYCHLSCYLGQSAEAHEVAGLVASLRERDRNNVAFFNRVFLMDDSGDSDLPARLPELDSLPSLLKTGTKEAVKQEVERYLEDLVRNLGMDAETLHRFGQDFMQALYSFLNAKGIQAHRLFGDEQSRSLSEASGRSVPHMLTWVHHALGKAMFQAEAAKENDTVVDTVKRYIAQNMDQDLSREFIAEQVFLNPDYLSRIFKKETGYSISDYVLLARINKAKELLLQTNIPISAIALSVGYSNFSHFAKMFKKYAGIGPTELRNQAHSGISQS